MLWKVLGVRFCEKIGSIFEHAELQNWLSQPLWLRRIGVAEPGHSLSWTKLRQSYHSTVTGWSHPVEGRPNVLGPDSLKFAAAVTSFPALIHIGDPLVTD